MTLTVSGTGGTHTRTRAGYIQVEPVTRPPVNPVVPLEIGELEIDHEWQRVELQHTFSDPIVVVKALSFNESDPAVVRIKDIDATGFSVRVQEWDYLDGVHAFETAAYMVMERGRHQLPNGVWVEAGSVTTRATNAFQYQAFSTPFASAPVVFAAITTVNEEQAVNARLRSINTNGFSVGMREQEANKQQHLAEQIDYIAWEPSSGLIDGLRYEVGRTGNKVTHQTYRLGNQSLFEQTPLFLADMQTTNGGDTASLRWRDLNALTVDLWVQEEQSKDQETGHAREDVGYLFVDVSE